MRKDGAGVREKKKRERWHAQPSGTSFLEDTKNTLGRSGKVNKDPVPNF